MINETVHVIYGGEMFDLLNTSCIFMNLNYTHLGFNIYKKDNYLEAVLTVTQNDEFRIVLFQYGNIILYMVLSIICVCIQYLFP